MSEVEDLELRIRNLEEKLAFQEGVVISTKRWVGIVVAFSLTILGITSWTQIPKLVDEKWEEIATEQIYTQLDEALADVNFKVSRVENLKIQAISIINDLEKAQGNINIASSNENPISSSEVSAGNGESSTGSIETATDNGEPSADNSETPTEGSVTGLEKTDQYKLLLRNVWAKEGYYLLIDTGIELHVNKILDSTVEVSVIFVDSQYNQGDSLTEGNSLVVEGPDLKYRIDLINIGKAGFNPFNNAAYFSISST